MPSFSTLFSTLFSASTTSASLGGGFSLSFSRFLGFWTLTPVLFSRLYLCIRSGVIGTWRVSGSGPGERWTSRLYHWFCYIFMCLHVSLVYCVLCIVSRVSCVSLVSHYHHHPHVFIRSLCAGEGCTVGVGAICALWSVLCALWSGLVYARSRLTFREADLYDL